MRASRSVDINGNWECSRCHLFKSPLSFYPSKVSKSGLHVYCKDCCRAYSKETARLQRESGRAIDQRYKEALKHIEILEEQIEVKNEWIRELEDRLGLN